MTIHRMGKRFQPASAWNGLTQLALLGMCFFLGSLGGFFFSLGSGNSPELSDYLLRYFQLAAQGSGTEPSLWTTVWDLVRWPLAVFLLGGTALGAVGIPLLMGMRGFLLSFASATFVRLFGLSGIVVSLAAFGVTALVAIPVFFVVGADAFHVSLGRLAGSQVHWDQRVRALTPCAGLLVLAAALQQTAMPVLFSTVCARLFL